MNRRLVHLTKHKHACPNCCRWVACRCWGMPWWLAPQGFKPGRHSRVAPWLAGTGAGAWPEMFVATPL